MTSFCCQFFPLDVSEDSFKLLVLISISCLTMTATTTISRTLTAQKVHRGRLVVLLLLIPHMWTTTVGRTPSTKAAEFLNTNNILGFEHSRHNIDTRDFVKVTGA
jgi:hypothetical protein